MFSKNTEFHVIQREKLFFSLRFLFLFTGKRFNFNFRNLMTNKKADNFKTILLPFDGTGRKARGARKMWKGLRYHEKGKSWWKNKEIIKEENFCFAFHLTSRVTKEKSSNLFQYQFSNYTFIYHTCKTNKSPSFGSN